MTCVYVLMASMFVYQEGVSERHVAVDISGQKDGGIVSLVSTGSYIPKYRLPVDLPVFILPPAQNMCSSVLCLIHLCFDTLLPQHVSMTVIG